MYDYDYVEKSISDDSFYVHTSLTITR